MNKLLNAMKFTTLVFAMCAILGAAEFGVIRLGIYWFGEWTIASFIPVLIFSFVVVTGLLYWLENNEEV